MFTKQTKWAVYYNFQPGNIFEILFYRGLSKSFPYTNIELLDISSNKMTDKGLLHIVNCLKKEHPIQGLYLRGNKIGEATAKVLFSN